MSAGPPPGIYSASASLLSPPLNARRPPQGHCCLWWGNPPAPPQPSHWPAVAAFSFSNLPLALASPASSCLPVTTHLSRPPHCLSFSSALQVSILKGSSFFVCAYNSFLLNLHIFSPLVVSNTPSILITICMLTAFKSVSSPASFFPQSWTYRSKFLPREPSLHPALVRPQDPRPQGMYHFEG